MAETHHNKKGLAMVSPQERKLARATTTSCQDTLLSAMSAMWECDHQHHSMPLSRDPDSLSSETPQPRRSSMRASMKKSEDRRSVKFGGLTIREHAITIGDHPWKDGPPIALSWEQVNSKNVDLEEFERMREGSRRKEENLRRPGLERRQLLKQLGGFSDSELMKAQRFRTHIKQTRASRRPVTLRSNQFHSSF